MSAGVNKVILVGRLGRDPEVRFGASGNAVCNFSLAINERQKDKEGTWQDVVEWVNCVCFGKTAENCGQYLAKGKQAYVEGKLSTREWQDKEGNKRKTTEVVAFTVVFLGDGGGAGKTQRSSAPAAGGADEPPPLNDSDIPF